LPPTRQGIQTVQIREEDIEAFLVQVQTSDMTGKPLPNERPRWHSTFAEVLEDLNRAGYPTGFAAPTSASIC